MFKKNSKAALFLELAKPKNGFSHKVYVKEFVGRYERLLMGNGGDWCRADGSLARVYNVERGKERGTIVYVKLHGFQKNPIKKPIPQKIRQAIVKKPCAVLGTSRVEVDHRDGRRDDPRLSDPARLKISDFQPLSKAVNNAKRQHCKDCRRTNRRFDAKKLGYRHSQIYGNGQYRGTCVGCYWHGPVEFNRAISQGYRKRDA